MRHSPRNQVGPSIQAASLVVSLHKKELIISPLPFLPLYKYETSASSQYSSLPFSPLSLSDTLSPCYYLPPDSSIPPNISLCYCPSCGKLFSPLPPLDRLTDTTQWNLWLHQLPGREGPQVHHHNPPQW